MDGKIRSHRDLEIYKAATGAAMDIFELSKVFPREEACSLMSQIKEPKARPEPPE